MAQPGNPARYRGALLLAGMVAGPAFALWGDTESWQQNVNVLKIRMNGWTGMQIPGFGDPISAATGCHAYVIGVDEANRKVCAITAWHCLADQGLAYGDNFPQGTPIEQQLSVAGDIGLIRLTDDNLSAYTLIARAAPDVRQPVSVVGRTQEDALPGRSIYCRGEVSAIHSGQVDDGFEVDLKDENCEQGRSITGYSFDSGSPITTSSGALVGVTNSQCDSSAPGEGQGECEGALERHSLLDRVAGNNPSAAGVDVAAGLETLGCSTYDGSWGRHQ